VIVDPWEAGIRIRAGKWVKDVGPGPHFTIPFVDCVETVNIKKQWVAVEEQTVETADKIAILLISTVNYSIKDARKIWLEVQDHDDSLAEECAVILANWINRHNYDEVTTKRIIQECLPAVKIAGLKWGCEIIELGIKTLSKHRAYRLLMS
jgi:regulator of protease activity HflC (stomatin/prohibitin superfamily)